MKKKADPRHQARRIALQTLFEWSFLSREPKEILQENLARQKEDLELEGEIEADQQLVEVLIHGVIENRQQIDLMIKKCAPEWPIEQTAKIDLTILRMAVFEIVFGKTAPTKVVIDEAVELGKEFGAEGSGGFVNGVLGTMVEKLKVKSSKLQLKI